MNREVLLTYRLIIVVIGIVGGGLFASQDQNSQHNDAIPAPFKQRVDITHIAPSGDHDLYLGSTQSPGIQMGSTQYDLQHNSSMGRQVAFLPGENYVHFVWTSDDGSTPRHIEYNTYDLSSSTWVHADGMSISDQNGGFTTIDVTSTGSPVVAAHWGPLEGFFSTWAGEDMSPPMGGFIFSEYPPPPNCENIITGNCENDCVYIWPVIDWDVVEDDTIYHLVSTESPWCESDPKIRTLVYYRSQSSIPPSCGMFVDSVYTLSAVVRSDPNSDNVAIVWLHPLYYDSDPSDPCGYTISQQDVYFIESTDGGITWPRDGNDNLIITNITDYASLGPIDQQPDGLAYSDLSALYDTDGTLHIVWNTSLRDLNGDPCEPLPIAKLWHWDNSTLNTSLVYDASEPHLNLQPGGYDLAACKMNISECDNKLYVLFTRFGAHTSGDGTTNLDNSAGGYSNGDIFVAASTDGGATWPEAANLTNTQTDDCAAGDCDSEHWSSMSEYSDGSLRIQYISDKDAGAYAIGNGAVTDNPVMYLECDCFTPTTDDPDFWIRDCASDDGSTTPTCQRYWEYSDDHCVYNYEDESWGTCGKKWLPGGWNRIKTVVRNRGGDGDGSQDQNTPRVFAYWHEGAGGLEWPPDDELLNQYRIVHNQVEFLCEEYGCAVSDPDCYKEDEVHPGNEIEFEWFWKAPEISNMSYDANHICIGFVINPDGPDACAGCGDPCEEDCGPVCEPEGLDHPSKVLDPQGSERHPRWNNNVAQINLATIRVNNGEKLLNTDNTTHVSVPAFNRTGSSTLIQPYLEELLLPGWTAEVFPSGPQLVPDDSFFTFDVSIEAPVDAAHLDTGIVRFSIVDLVNPDETIGGLTIDFTIDNYSPDGADLSLTWYCPPEDPDCCPPWLMPYCHLFDGKAALEWEIPTMDEIGFPEKIWFFIVCRDTIPEVDLGDQLDSVALDIDLSEPRFQYVDGSIDYNTSYYYRIYAVDEAGNISSGSNVVQVLLQQECDPELCDINLGSFNIPYRLNDNSKALIDVGLYAVPDFVDIDNDGDYDLFIGDWDGEIWFYRNDGDATNPSYTFVTSSFESIDVDRSAAPKFADIDNDGDYDLFIGNNYTVGYGEGNMWFYENVGTANDPSFVLISSEYLPLVNTGIGKAGFVDIDCDGDLDMFFGYEENYPNGEYGLVFYRNDGTPYSPSWTLVTTGYNDLSTTGSVQTYYPDFVDIDCDGDFDLLLGRNSEYLMVYYRNDCDAINPVWTFVTYDFNGVTEHLLGNNNVPQLLDLDGDGSYDLCVGVGHSNGSDDEEGVIQVFLGFLCGDVNGDEVIDIDDVVFLINYIFSGGPAPEPSASGDVNCDGTTDIDDVVYLIQYIFSGGPAPCLGSDGESSYGKVTVGDVHMAVAMKTNETRNIITLAIESEQQVQALQLEYETQGDVRNVKVESLVDGIQEFYGVSDGMLKIGLLDLYGQVMIPSDESDVVMISHEGDGELRLSSNIAVSIGGGRLNVATLRSRSDCAIVPEDFALHQNYPNPFNPTTEIGFSLPEASHTTLDIYNIMGQTVATLIDEYRQAGNHEVTWNANGIASGVYLYRLTAGEFTDTKRMLLLK